MRAATAEFATHGYAGGRITRIVKKAGSNPRTIYEQFGCLGQSAPALVAKQVDTPQGDSVRTSNSAPFISRFQQLHARLHTGPPRDALGPGA
ncbi:TetR family transcriptional regulator [Bradyrhizobium sp. CSA207]|uniref:TetR family transcriptional regulator n=1 Tax=Bradyrhizobium sp. CSA207 TaxID=2698826 RepID=UPI0023AFDD2B|nr:TetR family transcriptional regulator [Bradyrhizobium sp. CSA207]MDE5441680.1 TetR family transcriptional regulator [Bradyrhizobium sp. CSA207]